MLIVHFGLHSLAVYIFLPSFGSAAASVGGFAVSLSQSYSHQNVLGPPLLGSVARMLLGVAKAAQHD